MAEASRWRRASRRAIDAALAALPAGATEAQRRAAVRRAYPFGQRTNHPYKCWLAEVRAVLGRPKPADDPEPRYVLLGLEDGGLVVRCGWCVPRTKKVTVTHGCVACGPLVDALDGLLADGDFLAMLRGSGGIDPLPRLVLADWLDERGHGELAMLFREVTRG